MYCHGLCRRKGFSFVHALSDNIYTDLLSWKLRVIELWCGENKVCFKLVFRPEYASMMNQCICLSLHMLSLKLFEKCFPFNRVFLDV